MSSPRHSKFQGVQVGQAYQLPIQDPRTANANRQELQGELAEIRQQQLAALALEIEQLRNEAQAEAEQILAQAHEQAKAALLEAEQQRDGVFSLARQEGQQVGHDEAYAEASAEIEPIRAQIQSLLETAYEAKRHVFKGSRRKIAELIQHLTQLVLQEHLTQHPKAYWALIDRAIDSLHLNGRVKIVVHPSLYEGLRRFQTDPDGGLQGLERFELVHDALIDPQEVFVLGENHAYSIGASSQVAQLVQAMVQRLPMSDFIDEQAPPDKTETAQAEPDQSQADQAEPVPPVLTGELMPPDDDDGPDSP